MTELIIYDLIIFNLPLTKIPRYNNSGRLGEFIVYVAFSHVFLAPEILIPDVYGTKNRRQKVELTMAPVSGVCVTGITPCLDYCNGLAKTAWTISSRSETAVTDLSGDKHESFRRLYMMGLMISMYRCRWLGNR